jgi:hypothetical protein
LVPAELTSVCTDWRAPVPSATMVSTAATPMMIPSMVNAVRRRLRFSERAARRRLTVSKLFMQISNS